MSETNAEILAIDGTWVLYGLLGGGNINFNLFNIILAKRAKIIGTTLSTRSYDYKVSVKGTIRYKCNKQAELIHDFELQTSKLFETGKLVPIIDTTFNFDQIQKAHKYMEGNKNIGKILIKISDHDEL